jgi:hypothetical protein
MATRVVVRGAYARQRLVAAGAHAELAPGAVVPSRSFEGRRLYLAGGGAARGGSAEALAALDALPEIELVLTPGEGIEPPALMRHPRVRAATEAERERLEGVGVVIAPAWCESYSREIGLARRMGVPRIATEQAGGAGDVIVPRGDVGALVEAIRRVANR